MASMGEELAYARAVGAARSCRRLEGARTRSTTWRRSQGDDHAASVMLLVADGRIESMRPSEIPASVAEGARRRSRAASCGPTARAAAMARVSRGPGGTRPAPRGAVVGTQEGRRDANASCQRAGARAGRARCTAISTSSRWARWSSPFRLELDAFATRRITSVGLVDTNLNSMPLRGARTLRPTEQCAPRARARAEVHIRTPGDGGVAGPRGVLDAGEVLRFGRRCSCGTRTERAIPGRESRAVLPPPGNRPGIDGALGGTRRRRVSRRRVIRL